MLAEAPTLAPMPPDVVPLDAAELADETVLRDVVNSAVYNRQAVSKWRGVAIDKCAQDMLVYQEIVLAQRPARIVETGAWHGGGAIYLADLLLLAGHTVNDGLVVSVDLDHEQAAHGVVHPLVEQVTGSSVDPRTVARVHELVGDRPAFVLLDADHSKAHVLAELDAYADLVPVGGYLVVEDTNINGHPVRPETGPGPLEAVEEWLADQDGRPYRYAVDHTVEPYVTFAPGGYLRRIA